MNSYPVTQTLPSNWPFWALKALELGSSPLATAPSMEDGCLPSFQTQVLE